MAAGKTFLDHIRQETYPLPEYLDKHIYRFDLVVWSPHHISIPRLGSLQFISRLQSQLYGIPSQSDASIQDISEQSETRNLWMFLFLEDVTYNSEVSGI